MQESEKKKRGEMNCTAVVFFGGGVRGRFKIDPSLENSYLNFSTSFQLVQSDEISSDSTYTL